MKTEAINKLKRALRAESIDSVGWVLIYQAGIAADPDCPECLGSGLIGWGLMAGGRAAAIIPCIRCRREEYDVAVKPFVKIVQKEQEKIERERNQANEMVSQERRGAKRD